MKTQIYEWRQALKNITLKNCAITLLGSFILAFGLYNVHSISGVTEGGVLGATLLLEHWTGISPAFTGGIMNILCYILGWKLLGKEFIAYSALATAGFSGTYKICEQFPHLWPELANMPLLAALVGALFVGVGAGLCVRIGGAPSGDDAPGHEYFPCYRLEDPVGVSDVGSDRTGNVLKLHSGETYRIFVVYRAYVRTADRPDPELRKCIPQ